MKIEIFELEYLKFIFSSFWIFAGFCLLLLIITGGIKSISASLKSFFSKVSGRYKRITANENLTEKLNKHKPKILE